MPGSTRVRPPPTRRSPTRLPLLSCANEPPTPENRLDPLIAAGSEDIDCIDDKDTDLLRRFDSDRGKIRSRRVTRLTVRQQRAMARAVRNARETALLPYTSGPAR